MGVVPPRAFISYSASDETQDFVRWLRERLAGSGLVTPWLDEIDMRKIGAWRP